MNKKLNIEDVFYAKIGIVTKANFSDKDKTILTGKILKETFVYLKKDSWLNKSEFIDLITGSKYENVGLGSCILEGDVYVVGESLVPYRLVLSDMNIDSSDKVNKRQVQKVKRIIDERRKSSDEKSI